MVVSTVGRKTSDIMLIRAGFEVTLDFVKPTPVVLMPYIHPSRTASIRQPDRLTVNPHVPVSEYNDVYGNRCGRAVVQAGCVTFRNDALVEADGQPDRPGAECVPAQRAGTAERCAVVPARQPLLRGRQRTTRHCLVSVWNAAGGLAACAGRVHFTHRHIRFDYMQARANRTALAVFSRAHRSLPRLHAPGHHILQVLEHTGAVLHRVPRRYQGAGGGVSHGFQRLV
jgi:hypothetical protein